MSNFLIAYPQNNYVVDYTLQYGDVATNYYYYNLLGGARALQFKREAPASTSFIQIDYEFNESTTIDSIFIGDLKEVINDDWSAAAAVATRIVIDAGETTIDTAVYDSGKIDSYVGVYETDFVANFTAVTKKLWRIYITAVESDGSTLAESEYKFSKLFLCAAIDLGKEPSAINHIHQKPEFIYSLDGNLISNSNHINERSVELEFKGVSDANLTNFLNALDVDSRGYMALFNTSSNIQLLGSQCVYGWCSDVNYYKIQNDYNYLSFRFDERL